MKYLAMSLVTAVWLTACQPAATAQPAPAQPTSITETGNLSTALPPPTVASTPAPVEALAGSVDDLIGTWWFPQGPIFVELKADGTYRVWDNYSGTQAEGNYTFEAGRITWATSQPTCNDQPATYEAYLSMLDGIPVQLRLIVVGTDPCGPRLENTKGIAKPYTP